MKLKNQTLERDNIIYLCAESVRISGILLQPCMPTKMKLLLDVLGVGPTQRSFRDAEIGLDANYGTTTDEYAKNLRCGVFPPLWSED